MSYCNEPLLTLHEAAQELGLPYFKLQRAARKGLVPTYSLFNSRKYVRKSELLQAMASNAVHGASRQEQPR